MDYLFLIENQELFLRMWEMKKLKSNLFRKQLEKEDEKSDFSFFLISQKSLEKS